MDIFFFGILVKLYSKSLNMFEVTIPCAMDRKIWPITSYSWCVLLGLLSLLLLASPCREILPNPTTSFPAHLNDLGLFDIEKWIEMC